MTETLDTVDETAEDVDEGVEEETTEEAGVEEDNSKDESDAEDEGTAEDEDSEEDQDDEDEEPPTRKPRTNADWVAKRRKDKLDKKSKDDDEGEADEDFDEEVDVSDEDAKIISKVIDKKLAPFQQQQEIAEVKSEIDEFVADNPDFKQFAAKALKWSQHPTWKNVPTKNLMHAAAGDNLMKIGAKRSKLAQEKARKTKTGTGTGVNTGGSKSVNDMTDEEFAKEVDSVKSGN